MDIGTAVFVIGGLMMILPALYAAINERAVWQLIEGNPDKALQASTQIGCRLHRA
jgi:hypothetical protein